MTDRALIPFTAMLCRLPREPEAAMAMMSRLIVSGVMADGVRRPIDPLLLPQLVFDLEHDKATTSDRELSWRALAVEPRDAPSPPAAMPRSKAAQVAAWYRESFPDGHPPGLKLEALAARAGAVLGYAICTRTLQRAIATTRHDKGRQSPLVA